MAFTTRFIGCLHLGHTNMAHHRGFQDEFYHDEHLIQQWNSVVGPRDITWILGDVTMEKTEPYYNLNLLNGIKKVVLGNHDKYQHTPELLKYVDYVCGMAEYKGFCLTHCPIHPNEIHFYRGNIHAHIHHINKLDNIFINPRYGDEGELMVSTASLYYNVDAKLIDFKPRTLEEIINENN